MWVGWDCSLSPNFLPYVCFKTCWGSRNTKQHKTKQSYLIEGLWLRELRVRGSWYSASPCRHRMQEVGTGLISSILDGRNLQLLFLFKVSVRTVETHLGREQSECSRGGTTLLRWRLVYGKGCSRTSCNQWLDPAFNATSPIFKISVCWLKPENLLRYYSVFWQERSRFTRLLKQLTIISNPHREG